MSPFMTQARIPELVAELSQISLPKEDGALILEAIKRLRAVSVLERDHLLARAALDAYERLGL